MTRKKYLVIFGADTITSVQNTTHVAEIIVAYIEIG